MKLRLSARAPLGPVMVFLWAVSASALPAQTQVDQGTFQVSVEGRPAGTEQFSIQQNGSGSGTETIASGEVRLRLEDGGLTLAPRLRAAGLGADPVSYQVEVGGSAPQRIVGTVGGGRFSAKIITPSGEALREYVASNGATVLDDAVAHHYYFLAQRFLGMRVPTARIPVLIPRENRQATATVRDRGPDQVQIGGSTVTAERRLMVQLKPGEQRSVWLDALNRVLRVEICRETAGGCTPVYGAVRSEVPS